MRPALLALLLFCSTAGAGTMRMRVHMSTGEMIPTAKACPAEMRIKARLWKHLAKGYYVELDDDSKTLLVAAGRVAERVADRIVASEPFVGFFDNGKESIAVMVFRDRIHKGWIRIDFALIVRDGADRDSACSERWSGSAKIL